MNHIGVVKALEFKLPPCIVSGGIGRKHHLSGLLQVCSYGRGTAGGLESSPEGDLAVFEAEGEEETMSSFPSSVVFMTFDI